MAAKSDVDTKSAATKSAAKSATKQVTTRSGKVKTVSRAAPAGEVRRKRAASATARASAKARGSAKQKQAAEKGLLDLFEHALRDMYYAEKKIYRALPKMVKAAEDEALAEALSSHREETQSHIETLEEVFALMGLRAKGEKCDAIDGILEEAEGILEDFGGTLAGDAAIIFSAAAVEHYEICRYKAMVGFANALGLDEAQAKLQAVLDQEVGAEAKMAELAEGSINEAASDYDDDDAPDDEAPDDEAAKKGAAAAHHKNK